MSVGVRAVVLASGLLAGSAWAQTPPTSTPRPAQAAVDPLLRARQLYNTGDFDGAIVAAVEAAKRPALAATAALVQGRAHLERYRKTAAAEDLTTGRDLLAGIDASKLPPKDRPELAVGLAQALFLEDQFGAAAEMFATAADGAVATDPETYDRLVEWWAASVDRYANARPPADRAVIYAPLIARLEHELRSRPESAPASYWLAATARGSGDADRAWNLAIAAWVRAPLTGAHAAALRTDLDQLVMQGIIPDRVRRAAAFMPRPGTPPVTTESLTAEWEQVKERWK